MRKSANTALKPTPRGRRRGLISSAVRRAGRLTATLGMRIHIRLPMKIELVYLISATAVGVGATLVLDLLALFLKRAFNIPSANYCLVGRWMLYLPAGIFHHKSIAGTPKKVSECVLGWIAHYVIGVIFAIALVALASPRWLQQPTVLPALLFGVATVVMPFFIMQPAFGLGVAASKTPNPTQARLRSLMSHTVFGVGLYISAVAVSFLLKAHA